MAEPGFLEVKVVAIHVECGRCGDAQRIPNDQVDGFTRHILQPAASWIAAHLQPMLVMVEVLADGETQERRAVS